LGAADNEAVRGGGYGVERGERVESWVRGGGHGGIEVVFWWSFGGRKGIEEQ
jgi:hypothetical protein